MVKRIFALAACAAFVLCAQTAPKRLEFETASVKAVNMTPMQAMQSGRMGWRIDDSLVDLQSVSLLNLVTEAFGVPGNQLANAPDWMNSTLFDVRAKLPAGSSKQQVPEMLQSLLADRFGLVVHHQSEIRPVYEMLQGNKMNLKPATEPNPPGRDQCAVESGHRVCKGMTMGELATLLSGMAQRSEMMAAAGAGTEWMIDRPVVDMTKLDGMFDFTLDYGRIAVGGRGSGGRGGDGTLAPLVNIRDSVNALGLRLQAAKRPFDVITIDHVERVPTGN